MMIRDLIDRCVQHDGEAWAALWLVVEDAALVPICGILKAWALDLSLAEVPPAEHAPNQGMP